MTTRIASLRRCTLAVIWVAWVAVFVVAPGAYLAVMMHRTRERLNEYRADPPARSTAKSWVRFRPIYGRTFVIVPANRYTAAAAIGIACLPPAILTGVWIIARRGSR